MKAAHFNSLTLFVIFFLFGKTLNLISEVIKKALNREKIKL